MTQKVLIVGGVAGGASTAARIRRLDEQAQIIMFERGPHVSFSNCSLPFYLSDTVSNVNRLLMMTPEAFDTKHNIEARVLSEVVAVHPEKKLIEVKNVQTGEIYEESYDKLVLSPGAAPIVPAIDGVEKSHVYRVRNVTDIEKLKEATSSTKRVAVIGGGFIGIEVAENLRLAGHTVSLVQSNAQILTPFDDDMVQILHKELMDQGVALHLNDALSEVFDTSIRLRSGKEIEADVVVLAIGVKPETTLAEKAGLVIGTTGGIAVNEYFQTSDPSIYAVGDAVEVKHRLLNKPVRLALAGPAQKQARIAADHMYGIEKADYGVIGSTSIQVFDYAAAATGLNEKMAKEAGFDVEAVYVIAPDKVGLMPNSHPLHFKLIYDRQTTKVLGAQAIGKGNADKRIDVMATLIMMNGTIEDVKDLELAYSPMFSTAKDVVNMAGLVATNLQAGRFKQVRVHEARRLVEENAFIVDVREEKELANGKLKNSVNIPLSELRDRLDEIPKDKPVYVHCRSAQRSYNATVALQQLGFTDVYNMAGSFLGICLYEYTKDTLENREPIVTNYNFK